MKPKPRQRKKKGIYSDIWAEREFRDIPRQGKKPVLLHAGKKCPKGWTELPGGVHLGKGMWLLRCERKSNA